MNDEAGTKSPASFVYVVNKTQYLIAQSNALRWWIGFANHVLKMFVFQARKNTFDKNFVFFIHHEFGTKVRNLIRFL